HDLLAVVEAAGRAHAVRDAGRAAVRAVLDEREVLAGLLHPGGTLVTDAGRPATTLLQSHGCLPIYSHEGSFKPFRAANLGSTGFSHVHGPAFRSAPHCAHRPLQSSRQSGAYGTARTTCSRTRGSRATASPSYGDRSRSPSPSSTPSSSPLPADWAASASDAASRSSASSSCLGRNVTRSWSPNGTSTGATQRPHATRTAPLMLPFANTVLPSA